MIEHENKKFIDSVEDFYFFLEVDGKESVSTFLLRVNWKKKEFKKSFINNIFHFLVFIENCNQIIEVYFCDQCKFVLGFNLRTSSVEYFGNYNNNEKIQELYSAQVLIKKLNWPRKKFFWRSEQNLFIKK